MIICSRLSVWTAQLSHTAGLQWKLMLIEPNLDEVEDYSHIQRNMVAFLVLGFYNFQSCQSPLGNDCSSHEGINKWGATMTVRFSELQQVFKTWVYKKLPLALSVTRLIACIKPYDSMKLWTSGSCSFIFHIVWNQWHVTWTHLGLLVSKEFTIVIWCHNCSQESTHMENWVIAFATVTKQSRFL